MLRDKICPLTTKEIRIRDDAEWHDQSSVSTQGAEKDREEIERISQLLLILYSYMLAGQ